MSHITQRQGKHIIQSRSMQETLNSFFLENKKNFRHSSSSLGGELTYIDIDGIATILTELNFRHRIPRMK